MMKRIAALFLAVILMSFAAQAHSVVLGWTASTDTGAGYLVFRLAGTCPTGTLTGFTQLNATAISTLTYTDSTVTPGTYCYYVEATLGGANSVPSNTATAGILPAAPTAVQVQSSN